MKRSTAANPSYLQYYAAQLGAIGPAGQMCLRRSSVLIVGAGGVGTSVASVLATTGVGHLVVVDPQRFSPDNFNRSVYATPRQIGQYKVDILAEALQSRPYVSVVPIVGRAETLSSHVVGQRIDLIITASNTIASRIMAAQFACRRSVPHVSAAVGEKIVD